MIQGRHGNVKIVVANFDVKDSAVLSYMSSFFLNACYTLEK